MWELGVLISRQHGLNIEIDKKEQSGCHCQQCWCCLLQLRCVVKVVVSMSWTIGALVTWCPQI